MKAYAILVRKDDGWRLASQHGTFKGARERSERLFGRGVEHDLLPGGAALKLLRRLQVDEEEVAA